MHNPTIHKLPRIDSYLELGFNQFQIIGRSIAGVETVFSIPQFNITFDTGRAPHFAYGNDFLALTHWHLDHAGGLAFYLGLRCLNSLCPLKIIVPPQSKEVAEKYLAALKEVCESQISYEVIAAGSDIQIKNGLTLRAIPASHSITANGYEIIETRHHLRPEFQNKPGAEIIAAKKKGIEINNTVETPILAFSGDARGDFLATRANKAKILIMECSFFGDEGDIEKIRKYGHTHISDWAFHAEKIESETVIMSHTSQRYSVREIEAQCKKHLPAELYKKLILFREREKGE